MNKRSLLLVFVVLLLAVSSVLAIQTGKLRVKAKAKSPAVLDAEVLDVKVDTEGEDFTADAVNVIQAADAAAAAAAASAAAPKKTATAPKRMAAKNAAKKSEVAPGTADQAKKTATKLPARAKTAPVKAKATKGKKAVRTYDDLPEYAAKAKELLAAAAEVSWPGQPLIQGCTPGECEAWCNACGPTTTCANKCFLYSSCNDECP